jgi:hypothetical protein
MGPANDHALSLVRSSVPGPSRSSRAISEACNVAGTDGCGTVDSAAVSRMPDSSTALVSSSTNSGTPSVRSAISLMTSGVSMAA